MCQGTSPSLCWTPPYMPSYFPEFPELEAAKTVEQRNGQSVWDHTMLVIDSFDPWQRIPIALLSGLFHDLGKGCIPPTFNNTKSMFPNHDIESAKIVKKRLSAWGASPYLIDRVEKIVSTHMYDVVNVTQEKTIRKFVAAVGQDNVVNWFLLRIADSRAYSNQEEYYSRIIDPFKTAVMSYLEKQPSSEQPDFTGSDTDGIIRINGGDAE